MQKYQDRSYRMVDEDEDHRRAGSRDSLQDRYPGKLTVKRKG